MNICNLLDAKEIIFATLRNQGYKVNEINHQKSTGIIDVTDKEGNIWDFTVPSVILDKSSEEDKE